MTDWRSISCNCQHLHLRLSPSTSIAAQAASRKNGRSSCWIATGAVTKWEPFSSNTRGRQLRSILRFTHTGEVAGIPGQTIAGIVSLGGAVLVFTGLALALRRLYAWFAKRASRRATGRNGTGERHTVVTCYTRLSFNRRRNTDNTDFPCHPSTTTILRPLDLGGVKTYPLASRTSKVKLSDFASPVTRRRLRSHVPLEFA